MPHFEPGLIEKLRHQYPAIAEAIPSIAARIGDDALNPNALLTYRSRKANAAALSSADRSDGQDLERRKTGIRNPTGHWDWDGGWLETGRESDYLEGHEDSVTRGVRQLVWLRRNRGLEPPVAADLIREHGLESAFPSVDEWSDHPQWLGWFGCRTRTSAESAVRFAGGSELPGRAGERVREALIRDGFGHGIASSPSRRAGSVASGDPKDRRAAAEADPGRPVVDEVGNLELGEF